MPQYADTIRTATPSIVDVADLIDGIGDEDSTLAWTEYSPTITLDTGSFSISQNIGRYIRLGELGIMQFQAGINVTSGSPTAIYFSIPFSFSTFHYGSPLGYYGNNEAALSSLLNATTAQLRRMNYAVIPTGSRSYGMFFIGKLT